MNTSVVKAKYIGRKESEGFVKGNFYNIKLVKNSWIKRLFRRWGKVIAYNKGTDEFMYKNYADFWQVLCDWQLRKYLKHGTI